LSQRCLPAFQHLWQGEQQRQFAGSGAGHLDFSTKKKKDNIMKYMKCCAGINGDGESTFKKKNH
jgi:hypothetical protein